jgi:hypothetical protein
VQNWHKNRGAVKYQARWFVLQENGGEKDGGAPVLQYFKEPPASARSKLKMKGSLKVR